MTGNGDSNAKEKGAMSKKSVKATNIRGKNAISTVTGDPTADKANGTRSGDSNEPFVASTMKKSKDAVASLLGAATVGTTIATSNKSRKM